MLNKKTLICLAGAAALAATMSVPATAQTSGSSSGNTSNNPSGTSSTSGTSTSGTAGTSGTSGTSSQDTSRSGAGTTTTSGTTPSTATASGNMSGQVHGSAGQQKAKSGANKSGTGNTTASTSGTDNSATGSATGTSGNASTLADATTTTSTSGTSGTAAAGSTGMPANSTTGTTSAVSSRDRSFMRELAHQNLAEIEMAKLAQTKTQNDNVRSFADRMLTDHTKALDDLRQLAQKKGVDLPTTADVAHKAQLVMFKAMPVATFDKNYISKGGISDHEKTHRLLVDIGNRAQDGDLKSLSASMLQVVQQHQQLAQQMTTTQPVMR